MLDEFYRVAFRKKIYDAIEQLQEDLDAWLFEYNGVRTRQGQYCIGRTPMQTFTEARHVARQKSLLDCPRPNSQRRDQDPAVPTCLSGRIETSTRNRAQCRHAHELDEVGYTRPVNGRNL